MCFLRAGSTNVLVFMKITIFDDRANSERSIEKLNDTRPPNEKRFWRIELFHQLTFQKTQKLLQGRTSLFEWIKVYIYTGEYNDKAIGMMNKSCGNTIREMNELITKENQLLQKIHSMINNETLKAEVREHVNAVKKKFEENKLSKQNAIDKQKRNAEAQKQFFEIIRKMNFVELRTTPLVSRNGYIQQKGVDVKLATDLIQLAHANAYDVAVLMTGDLDLKESIKMVREQLGKIVILLGYFSETDSTISKDLLTACDYFINTRDFTEEDIKKISEVKTRHET